VSTLSAIHDLPAPEAGDAVAATDDLLRSLVARLESVLPRAGKTGTLAIAATATTYATTITFPHPFPAGVVPVVQVTPEVTNLTGLFWSIDSVTNTGFSLRYRRDTGTANIDRFGWTAQIETAP
jgi:hypothetical protein